jgi:hypothetical protein
MLRRFLYLDAPTLSDYVSALEGGSRESLETKSVAGKSSEGTLDAKIVRGNLGRTRQAEETLSLSDTPQARFDRLTRLAEANPEEADWITVLEPDENLAQAGIGAIIDLECEIYIPQIIKAFSPQDGISQALDAMDELLPAARALGLDVSGIPQKKERVAVKKFADVIGGKLLIVGEIDDSDWHIAGQLNASYVNGDLEGRVRVTGKISNRWDLGTWKPLLALPGSSLLPRHERRALEKQKPQADDEQNYLEGPAVMLDILAIYRLRLRVYSRIFLAENHRVRRPIIISVCDVRHSLRIPAAMPCDFRVLSVLCT